jgi:hypothetical protein
MTMMGEKYFEWEKLRGEMNNSAQWVSQFLLSFQPPAFVIHYLFSVYQVTCNTEANEESCMEAMAIIQKEKVEIFRQ